MAIKKNWPVIHTQLVGRGYSSHEADAIVWLIRRGETGNKLYDGLLMVARDVPTDPKLSLSDKQMTKIVDQYEFAMAADQNQATVDETRIAALEQSVLALVAKVESQQKTIDTLRNLAAIFAKRK